MPLSTVAGVALLAGATLAGAALARSPRMPSHWLHGAAALVMAVLVVDLLPRLWSDLGATGRPRWIGAAAFAAGFAAASALRSLPFGSVPVAISAHRLIEGALLALVISPAAVAAFVTHSVAEGFAVGVPLRDAPHRTVAGWLAVACLSPVAGALLVPSGFGAAQPVLAAVAAGAIARAAVPRRGQPPESSSSAPSGTRSDSRSSSQP